MRQIFPILILISACGGNEPAPSLPSDRARNEEPGEEAGPRPLTRALMLDEETSAIALVVSHGEEELAVELDAIGAGMIARADEGRLVFSDIELELADILVGSDRFPPNGLHLTDLRATIDFTDLSIAQTAFVGRAKIRVRWSLATKQGALPIRPLETPEVEVHGTFALDAEDRATLELETGAPGLLFDAQLAVLKDLSVALTFREAKPR